MAGLNVLLWDDVNNVIKAGPIESAYTSETDTDKVLAPNGSNGVLWVARYFGTQWLHAESWTESSTTNTSPQTKATLSMGSGQPAGNYFVQFVYITKNDGATTVEGQLFQDDTSERHRSSHSEAEYHNFGGAWYGALSAGTHNFKIRYWRTGGAGTVYIKYARMVSWRT